MLKMDPNSWYFVEEKKTHTISVYHSSMGDFDKLFPKAKYAIIGSMYNEDDAKNYAQYKELSIKPDAIAFLLIEHKMLTMGSMSAVKTEEFIKLILNMRAQTGRKCFGKCMSLEQMPACVTCYEALNSTWNLCANVKCLITDDEIQKYIIDQRNASFVNNAK